MADDNRVYSRVKDVAIKLHDYEFYHSPTKLDSKNPHFVGRKRLINKLKNILTNSSVSSGAYLVTGYRGVGKTSLVNKVLKSLDLSIPFEQKRKFVLRALFIAFLLFVERLIKQDVVNGGHQLLFIVPSGLFFWHFCCQIILRRGWFDGTWLYPKYIHNRTFIKYFKPYIETTSSIVFASNIWFTLCWPDSSFWLFILILSSQTIILSLSKYVIEASRQVYYRRKKSVDKSKKSETAVEIIWNFTSINLSLWWKESLPTRQAFVSIATFKPKHLIVRINLGQDNLKELDVLRSLTRNILVEFKRSQGFFYAFPIGYKLVKFTVFVLTFSYIYYSSPVKSTHNQVKSSLVGFYTDTQNSCEDCIRHMLMSRTRQLVTGSRAYIDSAYQAISQAQPLKSLRNFEFNLFYPLFKGEPKAFTVLPNQLDYYYLLLALILWYLLRWISTIKILGITTHQNIYRRLTFLNERIQANIDSESSASIRPSLFSFRSIRKKSYPIAELQEIESELISILKEIQRLPRLLRKLQFIIVFDELDKIQTDLNDLIQAKEKENAALSEVYDDGNQNNHSQHQREAILAVLSNLKHFFTTAKAKFIFVAGRELYDAALADVSNRNYFLGSIFNEVIYVNSFLIESIEEIDEKNPSTRRKKNHRTNHTSMSEWYVCQSVIPAHFRPTEDRNLKTFYKYLIEKDNAGFKAEENEAERITLVLKSFIDYLTYRCHGTPKKLTALFEYYFKTTEDNEIKPILKRSPAQFESLLCTDIERGEGIYLYFDFYAQYKFSLISFLTLPFIYDISRYVRKYGDKLMVSTTYLLDHLYKFHNAGFSWRNLEVTPEIVDINKAPILRTLIQNLISFLGDSHLHTQPNGLYDFKFSKEIAYEIDFLSKISQSESAALNFTLDESQQVKRHYKRRLHLLKKEYHEFRKDNDSHVYAITFMHASIGDLHFYDQEYDDAIIEYKEAMQCIKASQEKRLKPLSVELLVVSLRIMLKKALTFEKKKSYLSAFQTYTQLTDWVIKSFEIDIEKLGLKKTLVHGTVFVQSRDGQDNFSKSEDTMNYLSAIEDMPSSFLQFDMLKKSSATEIIGFLYLPFVAKLFIKEKEKMGGITEHDINIVEREVHFLTSLAKQQEREIILSQFYCRIANLLFFRNIAFDQDQDKRTNKQRRGALYFYLLSWRKDIKRNPEFSDYVTVDIKDYLINKTDTFSILQTRADCFGKIGNALISRFDYTGSDKKFKKGDAVKFLKLINRAVSNKQMGTLCNFTRWSIHRLKTDRVRFSFSSFVNSALIHDHNGDPGKAAFQLLKILYVFERIIPTDEIAVDVLLKELEDFVAIILKLFYQCYEGSSKPEIERLKAIFKTDSLNNVNREQILGSLPVNSNIQEVWALHHAILLRLKNNNSKKHEKALEALSEFTPQRTSLYNMSKRFHLLNLKSRYNFIRLRKICNCTKDRSKFDELFEALKKAYTAGSFRDLSFYKEVEFYVADSIYCLSAIVRLFDTFDYSYIHNHTTLATSYKHLGEWCQLYELIISKAWKMKVNKVHREFFVENETETSRLYNTVISLLGSDSMITLNSSYNFDKAISHYKLAFEVHNGLYAYNLFQSNMHFLDEDYSDENLHFHAALERMNLNATKNKKKLIDITIQNIQKKLADNNGSLLDEVDIYNVESYMNQA